MFRRDKSEIKNTIILMSLRKKTEIVRKKKRIKIIHYPFGAFLYADPCFTTLSNTSNIIINDKTIKRL